MPKIVQLKITKDINIRNLDDEKARNYDSAMYAQFKKGTTVWAMDAGDHWLLQRDPQSSFCVVVQKEQKIEEETLISAVIVQ